MIETKIEKQRSCKINININDLNDLQHKRMGDTSNRRRLAQFIKENLNIYVSINIQGKLKLGNR